MDIDLKSLFAKLNPYCTKALEAAAGATVSRSGYEVTVEDLLMQLTDVANGDIPILLRHYEVDVSRFRKALHSEIEAADRGNTAKPVFSPLLVGLIKDAWMLSSTQWNMNHVRSAALMAALLKRPTYGLDSYGDLLSPVSVADLLSRQEEILAGSLETGRMAEDAGKGRKDGLPAQGQEALEAYTTDFTQMARDGELDPVFCRDAEIRQMIDILCRRRKNNPIVVGEAGVGKTAVVEGLALKIVEDDVPDAIRGATIVGLDMGRLQAGAGVKGEFEKRLKDVIAAVRTSPTRIILFIDEAHTLIGAGGKPGGGDAANLLKPALARGELRAIAATTWSEYKKFFEKDKALERRFQMVKLDEPSVEDAVTILRGLTPFYESTHSVYVSDAAVQTAASLSARYISGRQLPDKAVDVLDTACARVGVALTARPREIEDIEIRIRTARRERDARMRDLKVSGNPPDHAVDGIDAEIEAWEAEAAALKEQWEAEKVAVDRLLALRSRLSGNNHGDDPEKKTDESPETGVEASEAGRSDERSAAGAEESDASEISMDREDLETVRPKIDEALAGIEAASKGSPLVAYEVTPEVVSRVVSDWTGVPMGRILRDETRVLNDFIGHIRPWIKGQTEAVSEIGEKIRTAKAGLGNPDAPMGVFLLAGPTGVGKTESAIAVAELLFGGRQALVSVNMSEFQEKHTVSRLIGSPPGYVGYGEGGILTEAVRQRPYSVVLLDEVEKAAPDVLNLFYQVFDKGILADGEGREIDFRNTVIFLTSNLASDEIMEAWERNSDITVDAVRTEIRPILSRYFKPALLGRMTVIPYLPLDEKTLTEIIAAKLDRLAGRLRESREMELLYDADLVDFLLSHCREGGSGARDIDHGIAGLVLPSLSKALLERAAESAENADRGVRVSVQDDEIRIAFETIDENNFESGDGQ